METMNCELKEKIRTLSALEKLPLVDSILTQLDKPDPEIDKVRAEEARKRWKAYNSGKPDTLSFDEVKSKYKPK